MQMDFYHFSVLCIPVFAPTRERSSEPAGDGTGSYWGRISGNSEGLAELQQLFAVQGVQTRRASKKSTQAAPSNSLSLRGERFSSFTLLQDLLCVLQPSISTA
ncbi:hypothetical protein Nmel_015148 [Mimus melanotis]